MPVSDEGRLVFEIDQDCGCPGGMTYIKVRGNSKWKDGLLPNGKGFKSAKGWDLWVEDASTGNEILRVE